MEDEELIGLDYIWRVSPTRQAGGVRVSDVT